MGLEITASPTSASHFIQRQTVEVKPSFSKNLVIKIMLSLFHISVGSSEAEPFICPSTEEEEKKGGKEKKKALSINCYINANLH